MIHSSRWAPAHLSSQASEDPSMPPITLDDMPGPHSSTLEEARDEEGYSSAEDYASMEPRSDSSGESRQDTSDGEETSELSRDGEQDVPAGDPDEGDWHVVDDAAGPDPDRTVATLLNMLCILDRQARDLEKRGYEMNSRRGEVERQLLRTEPWALAREMTGEEAFWWERRDGSGGREIEELRKLAIGTVGLEVAVKDVERRRERVVRLLVEVWGRGI
ncbi:hypothetical protein D7B24_003449 [Verticillium nonalfalfae]|uniref:Uncharacterized protein n=1 Tax=Verticillium nonalfalfae TaxID=1051616 RepID=A0A3M9YKB8_9PEZI|nr:uncharacterized protein D7B24_003449 [Verticillium nonalfalfae]RNJ61037.1 hypothetical protein D7B24_003449 [Verticillium nonalfalfae]